MYVGFRAEIGEIDVERLDLRPGNSLVEYLTAAGLDVFETEPPDHSSLLAMRNVVSR